jgi:hypothetical protein
MTTEQIMQSNPWMTYGFAVGYLSGLIAKQYAKQFSGLSSREWRVATDDYAQGYRTAFKA